MYFRGNDAWYHFRETSYLLNNWSDTLPFDVWTGFPFGNQVGQFGTLWDHIMVAGVWIARPIVGSTREVMLVMAHIAGALVAIPTYLIARRFVRRVAAVVAIFILALLPGTFFSYSLVGCPDHSAAEVFFQSLSILAVAEREAPVWELVVNQDWDTFNRPATYAAAAGVALGLHMWTAARHPHDQLHWCFTGIFIAIKITSDVYHDSSPEPIAFAGTVSMGIAGMMQVIPLDIFSFVPT